MCSIPAYDSRSGEQDPLSVLTAYLTTMHQKEPCSKAPPTPKELEEIFRLGDFLFGSTFEGALPILDASESLVTKVVSAPSQRTAYLVISSGKQACTYLCLMPTTTTTTTKGERCSSNYYCSCRSFLEKNVRSPHLNLCKHLVALSFLPIVGSHCTTIETLTDEEFGRLIVSRGSPA